jgi:hypothetical protein
MQPTPDGALRSAFAGHVIGPAWLSPSLGRIAHVMTPSPTNQSFYVAPFALDGESLGVGAWQFAAER